MLATSRISKYKSKQYCNLDMFKNPAMKHSEKQWTSRDGSRHLIVSMETAHLWHCYNMLMGIIKGHDNITELSGEGPDWDSAGFMAIGIDIFIDSSDQADIAKNAIQYIGHELYKRGAQVPELPAADFRKDVNRADNLAEGFIDRPGECLTFNNE